MRLMLMKSSMNKLAGQALRVRGIKRVRHLYSLMEFCELCPRKCGTARLRGERGFCKSLVRPVIASCTLHFGEEPPISGQKGSGTIFFAGCNMGCVFCQNFPISQLGVGKEMTVRQLADSMMALEKRGAENINFVTPTHFAPQAAHAIFLARAKGFTLPVVWNSSGYESVETLKALEGFVDIYLCDFRYVSKFLAKKYSCAPDYPHVAESAISEMLRQVGCFNGDARRGVIVRHLCLPGLLEETRKVLTRIKEKFGADIPVSFMTQYFPAYESAKFPEINRRLSIEECEEAGKILRSAGFNNGWEQLIPD